MNLSRAFRTPSTASGLAEAVRGCLLRYRRKAGQHA